MGIKLAMMTQLLLVPGALGGLIHYALLCWQHQKEKQPCCSPNPFSEPFWGTTPGCSLCPLFAVPVQLCTRKFAKSLITFLLMLADEEGQTLRCEGTRRGNTLPLQKQTLFQNKFKQYHTNKVDLLLYIQMTAPRTEVQFSSQRKEFEALASS